MIEIDEEKQKFQIMHPEKFIIVEYGKNLDVTCNLDKNDPPKQVILL